MSTERGWYWWAGFDADVEHEGLYALGDYRTRDEAIAAGRASLPDIDGNTFFHIIEAQFGEYDEDEDGAPLDDYQPFGATRNHEIIVVDQAA